MLLQQKENLWTVNMAAVCMCHSVFQSAMPEHKKFWSLSFLFSTHSVIMTLASQLISPHRDRWLTLLLISGRSVQSSLYSFCLSFSQSRGFAGNLPCYLKIYFNVTIKWVCTVYATMCVLSNPQMVWENGCTVIVMMTALVEDGEKQCERYWPDEGSSLYHIYEVNFLS